MTRASLTLHGCGQRARLDGCGLAGPAVTGPWCHGGGEGACQYLGACPVAADLAGAIVTEVAPELLLQPGAYTAHPSPISPAHLAWLGRVLPVVERARARTGLDLHLGAWARRVRAALGKGVAEPAVTAGLGRDRARKRSA